MRNFVLGRWCVFGSATGDRKESDWPCHWTRSAMASITSRALPHWTWPIPPFPVRATRCPATPEALLPHCTCPHFTGLMSWNRPFTLDLLVTWLDKHAQVVPPKPTDILPKLFCRRPTQTGGTISGSQDKQFKGGGSCSCPNSETTNCLVHIL